MHFWQIHPWLLVLGNVLMKVCAGHMQGLYEFIFLEPVKCKIIEPNSIDTVPIMAEFLARATI